MSGTLGGSRTCVDGRLPLLDELAGAPSPFVVGQVAEEDSEDEDGGSEDRGGDEGWAESPWPPCISVPCRWRLVSLCRRRGQRKWNLPIRACRDLVRLTQLFQPC